MTPTPRPPGWPRLPLRRRLLASAGVAGGLLALWAGAAWWTGEPLAEIVPFGHGLAWAARQAATLRVLYAEHPAGALAAFAALAMLCAAVDLPAPGLVAAAGAAVFGVWPAVAVALPAAAVGAIAPFQLGRRLLGPLAERRLPRYAAAIRQGVGRDGAVFLLSLRLLPMMPFAVVNLLMGLTELGTGTFFLVTLGGRLPATVLYCNAGLRLAQMHQLGDLLSWQAIASLAAVAVCPVAFRLVMNRLGRRRPSAAVSPVDAA